MCERITGFEIQTSHVLRPILNLGLSTKVSEPLAWKQQMANIVVEK